MPDEPAAAKAAKDPDAGAPGRASMTLDAEHWLALVADSGLRGPARELAVHAAFIGFDDGLLRLSLPPADEHPKAPALVKRLADALAPHLGRAPRIRFEAAQAAGGDTLHERTIRERDARQGAAEAAFMGDPDVQRLINEHGARVVPDSIRPFDDN